MCLRSLEEQCGARWVTSLVEGVINWKAKAVSEAIGLVRHSNDGHEFTKHCVCHSGLTGERRVASYAIATAIGHAYRQIDQFLDKAIQRARRQDGLLGFPSAFQQRGIGGQILPEIVDVRLLPKDTPSN
jgi:hypothetical protein